VAVRPTVFNLFKHFPSINVDTGPESGIPSPGRAAVREAGDAMAFKLVVADPKTRKSYQKEVSEEGMIGKKIGENVPGSLIGLEGYELQLTGGSDKDGFPMRKDVDGIARKKILISAPPGFHPGSPGVRKRKSVRGNTVSEDIVQINSKVVKYGQKALDQLFASKKEQKPKEKAEGEKPAPEEKKAEDEAASKPEGEDAGGRESAGSTEEKSEEAGTGEEGKKPE
jgi:small subunit ribosomal protein S6e